MISRESGKQQAEEMIAVAMLGHFPQETLTLTGSCPVCESIGFQFEIRFQVMEPPVRVEVGQPGQDPVCWEDGEAALLDRGEIHQHPARGLGALLLMKRPGGFITMMAIRDQDSFFLHLMGDLMEGGRILYLPEAMTDSVILHKVNAGS